MPRQPSTLAPSAHPRGAFLSYGNEVSYTIKNGVPKRARRNLRKDLSFFEFVRFRVIYAEGIDGHGFDSLILQRTVCVVGSGLGNCVYRLHAFDDLAECSVLTVQMGRGLMHDEKLAACGIRDHGTRHGKNAFSMF